ILLFLYRIRAFLLLVCLEGVAIWLIVSFNSPQGAVFFNSSNVVAGRFLSLRDDVMEYFYLSSANDALAAKNAELIEELYYYKQPLDSVAIELDSALRSNFEFKSAKVVNNSLHLNRNYLTLDKGRKHGIKSGMGVFNEDGIVGRVKGVSNNFASVISLLHTESLVSSKIKKSDVFGSTKWDGIDSRRAKLVYVPRHVSITQGDTIVTSGYNSIFPEGINIGVVEEVKSGDETNYLDITITLAADFSKLTYVYLVENTMGVELDSLNEAVGLPLHEQ
ncbi:MAG TPA: rod shape-determining protein MreC, partial [Cyclobacteriaceae bacterium]|nr:rod shape-determining protein MreC [Cyclobacteriaceae bacterium]